MRMLMVVVLTNWFSNGVGDVDGGGSGACRNAASMVVMVVVAMVKVVMMMVVEYRRCCCHSCLEARASSVCSKEICSPASVSEWYGAYCNDITCMM